jgi:hypothetical protein
MNNKQERIVSFMVFWVPEEHPDSVFKVEVFMSQDTGFTAVGTLTFSFSLGVDSCLAADQIVRYTFCLLTRGGE